MAFDFSKILSKPADSIEKPKPLPVGMYLCTVEKYEVREAGDKGVAEITLKPIAPQDDVDMTDLQEQGGIGERRLRYSLWLDENALWKIKTTADALGVAHVGKSIGELLAEFPNHQCMATVIHKPSANGEEIYANVGKLLAA
jgi:hypothetical protein